MNLKSLFKKLAIICLTVFVPATLIWIAFKYGTEQQLETTLILIITAEIIFFFTYKISKFIKFTNDAKRLTKILFEDIDIERYIREIQDTIGKTKNKALKRYLYSDMALGYSAAGEYGKAINLMRSLDISDAMSRYKALYYNNLAYYYCESGNLEEAIKT